MIENLDKIINSNSFKNMIEHTGIGCKMIMARLENGRIAVYCKANVQNIIIFKVFLDEKECVELWNDYKLYNRNDFTTNW